MKFDDKNITAQGGKKALVTTAKHADGNSFVVTATVGSTTVEGGINLSGATDGPRLGTPSTAMLQAKLDEFRKKLADEAEWQEAVKLAHADLK